MPRCSTCATEFPDEMDACPACGTMRVEIPCEEHPDRRARGRCVACGRALCEECKTEDRRAFLCADHHGLVLIDGWAQVYTTTGEFEAQLVRDNLKAEGIDAQIFSQRDRIFAVEVGDLSIVRILVPVWDYGHALQAIRDHMDTDGEVAFACHSCGEAYDAGAQECTSCGAALT